MKKRAHSSVHSSPGSDTISLFDLEAGVEHFLTDSNVQGHTQQTLENRRFIFRKLLEFLRAQGYESCGEREITAFLSSLRSSHEDPAGRWGNARARKPLRPRSYSTYFGHLRTLFNFLTERRYIDISPMEAMKAPKARKDQIQPFSPDQIQALHRACKKTRSPERDEAIVMVLLDCGLRASEICNLKRRDIEMGERMITVLGKGEKVRRVPFSPPTARALTLYINRERKQPDDYMFTGERGRRASEPLTRSGLLQFTERLEKQAKISGVRCSPHTFRHTFAIEFLRAGGDVFTLKMLLGHERLDMTDNYVQIAQTDAKAAHNRASPVVRMLNRVK